MRVAHFSDPHLLSWSGARVRDFASKRWIGGMNLVANRAREHKPAVFEAMVADINRLGVDHVLCTGDVTNVALPGEFSFARDHFDKLGHGPVHTTVLPGNHDAYVADGVELFSRVFGDFASPDRDWAWPDGSRWPIVRVREAVAIIGVSTAHPTPWFNAWGEVGQGQRDRLRRVLSDPRLAGRFRLVAIHHPPAGRFAAHRRHGLRDHTELAAVLREVGAELVVHGHEHIDIDADLPGPAGGSVPVRGIRSATYAGAKLKNRAAYRVLEIGPVGAGDRPALCSNGVRIYDPQSGCFGPASGRE
jgi:3',5'-cyclic AMP phosphodiesterase CpdA